MQEKLGGSLKEALTKASVIAALVKLLTLLFSSKLRNGSARASFVYTLVTRPASTKRPAEPAVRAIGDSCGVDRGLLLIGVRVIRDIGVLLGNGGSMVMMKRMGLSLKIYKESVN